MAKKLVAFLLAVTVIAGISGPAGAVTISDLLAQIAALQAQLVTLQGGQQGTSASCLTKNLSVGMTDPQVGVLQGWLGVKTTSFFGPLTKAAVVAYQTANSISPAAGFVGSITRGSLNAKYCSGAPLPSGVPAPAGSVSVTLSPLTPAAGTLVAATVSANGAQAQAPVAAFRFTAPAATAVTVTSLSITRTGIAADSDLSNMYLFVNGAKVADSPSVASGRSTFLNAAGLFTVPAGSYVDLVVKVDLANGVTSGKTYQFGIAAAADVVSNAASVVGTFPMTGNVFSVATVSDLGQITVNNFTPSSNVSVDPGTTGYEVMRFSLVDANQPIKVSSMKFTMVGTADYTALQNVNVYVDGVSQATAAAMNADKTVSFTFATPVSLTSGQTRTVSVRADVVAGAGRNFYFEIANASDLIAMDATYGLYLKVNQLNVFTLQKGNGTISINAGSSSTTKSVSSPSGTVTANATNVLLASWDVKAIGEAIRVSQLNIQLATTHTVNNVYMTIGGVQYGTKASTLANAVSQPYTGTYVFPAAQTVTVQVYGDLTSPVVSGDSITVTLKLGASNGVLQTSGTAVNVPTADSAANALAVSAGNVTAVKNGSVASIGTVVGTTNVLIGSWLITAPSDQGVMLNGITFTDNTNSVGLGDAFNTMTLWSNGTQYGQTIASPSTSVGSTNAFTFGTRLAIAAGQTVQVDLRANVLTSATVSAWAGGASSGVKLSTVDATGNTTNSAVTFGSTAVGQLITLNSGATLTMSQEASPTMPNSTYLVAGDSGITLAAFRFAANNTEDVVINQIKLNETGGASASGDLKNIKLYVNGTQIGASSPAFVQNASNTVVFSDPNGLFTVPKNDYRTVVVKSDMTDKTNAVFADTGKAIQLSLYVKNATSTATTDVAAKGATSGQYATLAGGSAGGAYLSGNTMTFVETKPTFAYVAPSSATLVPGTMEVLRFRITAHSDADLKFNSTATSNVRLTILAGKAGSTGTVTLYDASNDSVLASSTAQNLASGQTVNFQFDVASLTVPAGQTKELYVKADLSTFSSTGNSFQVAINNAAADMSFNDSTSATAKLSAANYVGIGLPITGQTFVKP